MRLRRLELGSFRQFVKQTLRVDPFVTVLVGRNDTGKTGLLRRLFDQYLFETVIHSSDRPQLPDARPPIEFSAFWDVEAGDESRFPLTEAFGAGPRTLEVRFRAQQGADKNWVFFGDGVRVDVHADKTADGRPIPKDVAEPRRLLPMPLYLHIDRPILSLFEARVFEPAGVVGRPLAATHESSLLRLAGLAAETRSITGRGIDEPWEPVFRERSSLEVAAVEESLDKLSARLTALVRKWWADPPGLSVHVKLLGSEDGKARQHRINSWGFSCQILDDAGLQCQGEGLLWFLTFLINLELLRAYPRPMYLLLDEPAAPVHPSAQRMVAKLIDSLSAIHQVIYSTHSPFMIDWNFPQRVRLLERDATTRHTRIENQPYRAAKTVWDPLREAIGVTVGDVGVLSKANIFVEGPVDQILIANASAALQRRGRDHLDLEGVSILAYQNSAVLRYLLACAKAQEAAVVVLVDDDQQGVEIRKLCAREPAAIVSTTDFVSQISPGHQTAIEDVVGLESYVVYVNEYYAAFEWYQPLDAAAVRLEKGSRTLGRYLDDLFAKRYPETFRKLGVAVHIASRLAREPEAVPPMLAQLVKVLAEQLR